MYILGIIAATLVFASSFLKISNIPLSGLMLILGFSILAFGFLPLVFYMKYTENKNKGYVPFYIIGFATTFLLTLSGLTNAMNFSWGLTISIVSVLMLYTLFLPLYSYYIHNASKNKITNFTVIIAIIVISSFLTFSTSNNINRSLLDAFAFVDESISVANANIVEMNKLLYNQVSDFPNNSRNKEMLKFAATLQQKTDSVILLTDSLRKELIKRSNGEKFTSEDIIFIKRKDNTEIPAEVLLAENGAFLLKMEINKLKNFILENTDEEENRIFIIRCLSTDDAKDMTWEQKKFEYMPVISVINELNTIRQQVNIAEHYTLEQIILPNLD